jgi:hypothetical protein
LRLARGPARDIRQPAWHNRPDLIKAPAISAAVRSVLLFHRRADALGKCLSARLIAFDDALIFVSKSNGPPRPPGLRISGNRFRSVYSLRSRLLRWRGARQQWKHGDDGRQAHERALPLEWRFFDNNWPMRSTSSVHPDCLRQTHVVTQSIPLRCPLMRP